MSQRTGMILVAALVLPTALWRGFAAARPASPADGKQRDSAASQPAPNPFDDLTSLVKNPDHFAWLLFVHVNTKASPSSDSNDALWETWSTDLSTFPTHPNPADPPKWPDTGKPRTPAAFRESLQLRSKVEGRRLRRINAERQAEGESPLELDLQAINPHDPKAGFVTDVLEQVARNRPAFDYIVKNGLWYREGTAKRLKSNPAPITFPRDSIWIKAEWKILAPGEDRTRYHWNVDDKGNTYGLVGLHITSKAIPNWVWCTFEWVDNPGRSDYIGSRDAFGVKYPPEKNNPLSDATFQGPRQQLGSIYPPGEMTPELEALFAGSFGDDKAWIAQWKNYRLKGTQVDFTDSTGRPTLLGNTVSENGFVPTSSCITCHARATVVPSTGTTAFGGGFAPSVNTAGNVSYNGTPDPSWYFTTPGIAGGIFTGTPTNVPVDFSWGVALIANAEKPTKGP